MRRLKRFTGFLLVALAVWSLAATSFLYVGVAVPAAKASGAPASFVYPLMGTGQGVHEDPGNTTPAADSPFGMAQWGPDTTLSPPSGYSYASNTIRGFSLEHLSGAGCKAFGDFPFMPYVGTITTSPGTDPSAYYSTFSHADEQVAAGYYSAMLKKPGVKTELTVTPRTGMGQFTYPASSASTMIVNTGGSLNGDRNALVSIDPGNSAVSGWAVSGNFCGQGDYYKVYFYAQFNVPFTAYGTWSGSQVNAGSTSSKGKVSGAYVTFDTTQNNVALVKVGLSYVSIANAQLNVQTENSGWDFNAKLAAVTASWNSMLGKISVSGGTMSDTQVFYTSLYHALMYPSLFSDVNGQYIGFDNKVYTLGAGHAQYANYSGWDIYRTVIPLLALFYPSQTSDMMQSLVNDYTQSGCLPKWSLANTHTDVLDGDSADPILASAYAFGATNFDTATALQAMLKGATQSCKAGSYIERQALGTYLKHQYVPVGAGGVIGPASDTLEYSVDDFAISRLAQALGDNSDFQIFSQRAQYWQNVYNSGSGFIQPRNADGSFINPFNPHSMKGYYEGDAYQYSWMVPYNLNGLFTDMGGNAPVVTRLNKFFTHLDRNAKSQYANMGNEPCLTSVWDYDYVQQPWQTQLVTRQTVTTLYAPTPGGMPGNDDLGTMGAFVVWTDLGLYPQYAGVGDLVLGSPLFPQVTLTLGNGSTVQVTAQNAADGAPYIQSMNVNNQSSQQLWLPTSTLLSGGTLSYVMGSAPNMSWGSSPSDAPPSFAAGQ